VGALVEIRKVGVLDVSLMLIAVLATDRGAFGDSVSLSVSVPSVKRSARRGTFRVVVPLAPMITFPVRGMPMSCEDTPLKT
jgi:hypothetical protein